MNKETEKGYYDYFRREFSLCENFSDMQILSGELIRIVLEAQEDEYNKLCFEDK